MKAAVRDAYGGAEVIKIEDIEVPQPGPGEVRVRVRASSVNRADVYGLKGEPWMLRLSTGWFGPKQRGVGSDFAGQVDAVGQGVDAVAVGDAVFGLVDLGQAWAEYTCVPSTSLVKKPAGVSDEHAGATPLAGLTAYQGLRDHARVTPGQSVLINGATGAVGTFAVQLARHFGADVTGVCRGENVDLVRSLGATDVIAYDEDDFCNSDKRYDVVFDVAGSRPLGHVRQVMHEKSIYVAVGAPSDGPLGPAGHLIGVMVAGLFAPQKVAAFVQTFSPVDLSALGELIEQGAITPAIDRTFPLDEAAEALRYTLEDRPSAKVVLTMS